MIARQRPGFTETIAYGRKSSAFFFVLSLFEHCANRYHTTVLRIALIPLLLCSCLTNANALSIPDDLKAIDLSAQIWLLEDKNGTEDIHSISASDRQAEFSRGDDKRVNIGFSSSTWWVRVALRNDSTQMRTVLLRQTYPLIDYFDLYQPTADGQWQVHSTGDRRVFNSRDVRHRDLIFSLELPAQHENVYYIRVQSQGPVDINLMLYSSPELLGQISSEQLAYGIYFGCVIMLLLWSALVFAATRDKSFLAYFSYVAVFGIYMLSNNGIAFEFLWPNSPVWANASVIVLLGLSIITSLQFARMILRARLFAPRLDRFAQLLQLLALLTIAATPFLPYATLIQPIALLTLVLSIFMLVFGAVCLVTGSPNARVFLLAWGAYMVCSIAYLLKNFGWLPHTFLTQYSWQIGALLEMILLSLTLSSRVRELQMQGRIEALAQLAERERQVSENLRELDKLKGQFLANTSHELRTPLNAIIGLSDLVLNDEEVQRHPETRTHIRMIRDSGEHLLGLVLDILDFSAISEKKMRLNKSAVDIKTLFDSIVLEFRLTQKNPRVKLTSQIAANCPAVLADRNRLYQIGRNLVGNALKFTEQGHVTISAETHDGQLLVQVRDSGIGIPSQHRDSVFRRFEQVDGSPTRKHGGTGLGLAITKELVELHGGTIDFESTVGEGSVFTFSLPLADAQTQEASPASNSLT